MEAEWGYGWTQGCGWEWRWQIWMGGGENGIFFEMGGVL